MPDGGGGLEKGGRSTEEQQVSPARLSRAKESRGERVKEKPTLILFQEELSNNLCSPKMELGWLCGRRRVPAELGGHLLGRGSQPGTHTRTGWLSQAPRVLRGALGTDCHS